MKYSLFIETKQECEQYLVFINKHIQRTKKCCCFPKTDRKTNVNTKLTVI